MRGSSVWALLLLACACQARSSRDTSASPTLQRRPSATSATPPGAEYTQRLPEDPVAGARSLSLWQRHLEEEEEERKANYDRRHSSEHRSVAAKLRSAQRAYDRANTTAAVKRLQRSTLPALAGIRKEIDKIDHWRVSSNLLDEYDAVLEALATAYPAARLGELAGETSAATKTRRDVEAQLQKIDEWLARAEHAEDE
jgi:hypothetical protein